MMKYSKHAIHYKLIKNNDNDYQVEVWSNNIKYGVGAGTKIKEAQMQAAKDAYNKFAKAHRS
jgi:dsRNA-specific ribonuclease